MSTAQPVSALTPSRLHSTDLIRVGSIGLRTRRLRASLSVLGIAIGIAAMVAVLGISESSRADLLSALDRLGTNLLVVRAGGGIAGGGDNQLPATAEPMLGRIGPVQQLSSVADTPATVRRTDLVPETQTGGITVKATDLRLLDTLGGAMADGAWLNQATSKYPTVVLGAVAANRLGITSVAEGPRVWLGDEWFSVVGILQPLELAPDIDRAALVGIPAAQNYLETNDTPSSVYLRTDPGDIDAVRTLIPATANPQDPDQIEVSRPSDALAARAAARSAFTALFLGLGAVALLVGGVGIANVMVISVLERRSEIGLRRALGATRRHVAIQFLGEALLLSTLGGISGALLGVAITVMYDLARGWQIVMPALAPVGGLIAALVIGAIAGLYPATRAARLAPTEALRTA